MEYSKQNEKGDKMNRVIRTIIELILILRARKIFSKKLQYKNGHSLAELALKKYMKSIKLFNLIGIKPYNLPISIDAKG